MAERDLGIVIYRWVTNSLMSYSTLALKLKLKSHLTNQHMGKSIWSLAIFCHSSKFRTWDKVLHFQGSGMRSRLVRRMEEGRSGAV